MTETRRHTPERKCIVTGEVRPKAELLRFVVGPDGAIVPDPGEELPGRGIWCVPSRDVLEKARQRHFARAARQAVRVPDDLAAQVAARLHKRCLDRIGLAMRAGQARAGFTKVREVLERGDACVLVQARDAAVDGVERLRRLGRAARPDLALVGLFDSDDLGTALGRGPTVHVAVLDGGHADRLLRDCRRLVGFVPEADEAWMDTPTNRTAERDDERR
ncbi:hypothetical protein SAMN05216241_10734 [Limimonas halophila]|uniref:YlxR domain-containing protein n=1 Tax=Limimonas halophila TaxID=1082479 RepID=A0A1G7SJJ5_9PROT|nr:RNA-binding protein [Limimonas halophila]SDG23173.1 hypothetical protein SAMN05216241_10734 [Limimonas halophila]